MLRGAIDLSGAGLQPRLQDRFVDLRVGVRPVAPGLASLGERRGTVAPDESFCIGALADVAYDVWLLDWGTLESYRLP